MRIIIFGAGKCAQKLLKYGLRSNCAITGIVDNDSRKWGKEFENYVVESPDEIRLKNMIIF